MTTRPDPAPTNDNAALAEERAEWMESVDELIAARGINPAGRLLDDVAAHARARGVALTGRTPYRNTIPVQGQPLYPGDEALEARISAYPVSYAHLTLPTNREV